MGLFKESTKEAQFMREMKLAEAVTKEYLIPEMVSTFKHKIWETKEFYEKEIRDLKASNTDLKRRLELVEIGLRAIVDMRLG